MSLFPFLAVLLCTMGMLIMLLVLISRDTKDRDDERLALRGTTGTQTGSDSNPEEDLFSVEAFNEFQKRAEERSEESDDESSLPIDPSLKSPNDPESETVSESKPEPEDGKTDDLSEISPEESAEIDSLFEEYRQIYGEMSAEEIESQRETADWFLSELKGVREKTEASLKAERDRLAAAESQITKMMNQLIELNAKALAMEEDGTDDGESPEDAQTLKSRIDETAQKIADLQAEIEKLRKKGESQEGTSYAIVPYRGKAGTFRRPIYVECTGDGIYLMPENIPFFPEDFLVARYPGNPFDAGLRAARQYFIETGSGSEENEPYPLLILRPEAAQQYYVAKAALASWGGDFGYEFVEKDWEIEYPKADPELRRRVEDQVALSRARLAGPIAALMNELERKQGLSEATMEGDEMEGSGSDDSLATRLGPYARNDSGNERELVSGPNGRGEGGNLSPSGVETAIPFNGQVTSSDPLLALNSGGGRGEGDYQPAPSTGSYAFDPLLSGGSGDSGNRSVTPMETGGDGSVTQQRRDRALESALEDVSAKWGDPESTEGKGTVYAQTPSDSPQGTAAFSPFAGPVEGEETPDGKRSNDSSIDPRQTVGNSAFLGGTTSPEEGKEMGPSTTFEKRTDLSDPKDESKEPKVKRERESREINLAEEIQKPSQMAIERPITIECRPDGIFFPKQAGIVTARPIPSSDPEMDKTILETMIGCVRAWNVAGRNMYWSPWVRVKVTPGGEASYEHLVRLMKSQNVRIERASE